MHTYTYIHAHIHTYTSNTADGAGVGLGVIDPLLVVQTAVNPSSPLVPSVINSMSMYPVVEVND